jgi:Dolichyl-phosphate-mannose-protein mannosyltransferase
MNTASARRSPPRWLEPATLAVSFVVVCAVHAPLIGYKAFANVDEAYAGAIGERLLEGFKLYDGAVSQRGPLMYYAFEAIGWLHGWDNIVALRLWALAFCLANLFGVWWIARKLLSMQAAIVATAMTSYALAFGFPASDGCALHGETLQLPALLGAVLLGANAVRWVPGSPRRRLRLFGSGLLFGAAASIKQSIILHPGALIVWLAVDGHRRNAGRRAGADVLVLSLSTLLLPAAFLIHSAREGTLRALLYYTFTYNRVVHLNPTPGRWFSWAPNLSFRVTEEPSFFVVLTVLIALGAPWVSRRVRAAWRERSWWTLARGFGVRHFLALNLAIAVASGATMYRFFPHYFLQAWPFVALCAGAAVEPIARSRRWSPTWSTLSAGLLGLSVFCGWHTTVFNEKVDGRVAHDRTVDDVSKVITATTAPRDRIFVWGFSPWVYQYSHRRPAGRFVFETYVTGFVPWFWEKLSVERARVVPGSVEVLLGDLDREKPSVVVDAGSIMLARPMRAYAPFATWLHANYCFDVRIGAFDVYRRKPPGGADCVYPWFPRPFDAVDWEGRRVRVPIPKVADEEGTRTLPQGDYYKPIWFKDAPVPSGLDAMRDKRREKEEAEAEHDGFRLDDMSAYHR